MHQILDFNVEFNVFLFDEIVHSFYQQGNQEAGALLTAFTEHPDSWIRVDTILTSSQQMGSKLLALQILEKLIQTRWKMLPIQQRKEIRDYVVSKVIERSQTQDLFLKKFNLVLVQILKQEWPHNWPNFIQELVSSSRVSELMCENNMVILRLLSEDIFDFSKEQMTQTKIRLLKDQLCGEFSAIFHLCQEVLEHNQNQKLLKQTLRTLHRFLNWIPLGFVFHTNLIQLLCSKFLLQHKFITLQCLSEIALLNCNEYNQQFNQMFQMSMGQIRQLNLCQLPQETIQSLAMYLSLFLQNHINLVEMELLMAANMYLVEITKMDGECFKLCLDYWVFFLKYSIEHKLDVGVILQPLRLCLIDKMVKPEEVLIVENEDGQIVREVMKEVDQIIVYKQLTSALVYVTHLNHVQMSEIMLLQLREQFDEQNWSWTKLNKLCWSIGSISGSMSEEQEKCFVISVIRDLLELVGMKSGKDNKAVIASNIMYVVGQYPRFLKAHWRFLKTVVNKLFEFMHEKHDGVQDMACDTFIKIALKTKRNFIEQVHFESQPYIEVILDDLSTISSDLNPQQIHVLYKAIGHILDAQTDLQQKEKLTFSLMHLPNLAWDSLMSQAASNVPVLEDIQNLELFLNILKTNTQVATALKHYKPQMQRLFVDMLGLYCASSDFQKPKILHRNLRLIRREILIFLKVFVSNCDDVNFMAIHMVPQLLEASLMDYARNPQTRDAEVLNLIAETIVKLKNLMNSQIHLILEHVFACTLEMINKELVEYPEHRSGFFKLLHSIVFECFEAVLSLNKDLFKQVVNSIIWGFKHTMSDVAELGLIIIGQFLKNIAQSNQDVLNQFCKQYLIQLIQDIFFVLTDTEHKSGFRSQCSVLMQLMSFPELMTLNLGDKPNLEFLRTQIQLMLQSAFPHLTERTITVFCTGLFEVRELGRFIPHVRDFVIQLKQFVGSEDDCYLDEREKELTLSKGDLTSDDE